MENSTLEKRIWTQDDYDQMDWHFASIYGLSIEPEDKRYESNLLFDIDYVFNNMPSTNYNYWISPCTLKFIGVFELDINLESISVLYLWKINKLTLESKFEIEKGRIIYEWCLDLGRADGKIKFYSHGYQQYVRELPQFTHGRSLIKTRGGTSFKFEEE